MGTSDSSVRERVSERLEVVLGWKMTPAEWAEIELALSSVRAALDDGDADGAFTASQTILDNLGPMRPAPVAVLELRDQVMRRAGRLDSRLRSGISKDLKSVPTWRLRSGDWTDIEEVLVEVSAALERGDVKRAGQGTTAVARIPKLLGPAGETDDRHGGLRAPPEQAFETYNHIVAGVDEVDAPAVGDERT